MVQWRMASSWRRSAGPAYPAMSTALSTQSSFSSTLTSSQASRALLFSFQVGFRLFPQRCPSPALLIKWFQVHLQSTDDDVVLNTGGAATVLSSRTSSHLCSTRFGCSLCKLRNFAILSLQCRWILRSLCYSHLHSGELGSKMWSSTLWNTQAGITDTFHHIPIGPLKTPVCRQLPPGVLRAVGLWKPSLFTNPQIGSLEMQTTKSSIGHRDVIAHSSTTCSATAVCQCLSPGCCYLRSGVANT